MYRVEHARSCDFFLLTRNNFLRWLPTLRNFNIPRMLKFALRVLRAGVPRTAISVDYLLSPQKNNTCVCVSFILWSVPIIGFSELDNMGRDGHLTRKVKSTSSCGPKKFCSSWLHIIECLIEFCLKARSTFVCAIYTAVSDGQRHAKITVSCRAVKSIGVWPVCLRHDCVFCPRRFCRLLPMKAIGCRAPRHSHHTAVYITHGYKQKMFSAICSTQRVHLMILLVSLSM